MKAQEWNPQEALFAFMGWLTSRDEETHLSAHHEASTAVELIRQFSRRHDLADVRDGWDKAIIPEPRSGTADLRNLLERVNSLERNVAILRGRYCPSCGHTPCNFSGRTCPREGLPWERPAHEPEG